jgi:hypothetical protein
MKNHEQTANRVAIVAGGSKGIGKERGFTGDGWNTGEATRRAIVRLPSTSRKLRPDALAFTVFPKEIWRQSWSDNSRLKREIRQCTELSPRAILSRFSTCCHVLLVRRPSSARKVDRQATGAYGYYCW